MWSPDSKQISFITDRVGNDEIYVMNADGADQTRLTSSPGNDHSPAWSHDGRHISFVSERDGDNEIYVMNADGSSQINLTNNLASDEHPTWGPPGNIPKPAPIITPPSMHVAVGLAALIDFNDNLFRVFHFDQTREDLTFFDPRPAFASSNTLVELLLEQSYCVVLFEDQIVFLHGVEYSLLAGWNLLTWNSGDASPYGEGEIGRERCQDRLRL